MNKYMRWRTLPTQHSEGLAEARPQGPGAIFTLMCQHLPEQKGALHRVHFLRIFLINESLFKV